MKTYHIKDLLKKDLLILELSEGYDLDCTYNREDDETEIALYLGDDCVQLNLFNGYLPLLGKPDEIREDDAKEIVEKVMNGQHFQNYNPKEVWDRWCKTAKESLLSALETVIFWENPLGKEEPKCIRYGTSPERIKNLEWREAESRTFDRSRTLIFVKQ